MDGRCWRFRVISSIMTKALVEPDPLLQLPSSPCPQTSLLVPHGQNDFLKTRYICVIKHFLPGKKAFLHNLTTSYTGLAKAPQPHAPKDDFVNVPFPRRCPKRVSRQPGESPCLLRLRWIAGFMAPLEAHPWIQTCLSSPQSQGVSTTPHPQRSDPM